jgi:hypothetical protein
MTARSRRPPLIFQADEVPLARSQTVAPEIPESKVPTDVSPVGESSSLSVVVSDSASEKSRDEVNLVNRVNSVNQVNSPSEDKTSKVSGANPSSIRKKAVAPVSGIRGSKALSSPLSDQEMSFRDVIESPERVQIGPRIHPCYKEFLEDLFHPIRHQSDGGMQTMLMACLEVVRRDPELQLQAQNWASEGDPDAAVEDEPS